MFTIPETASILKVSQDTVRRLIGSNELGSKKIRGSVRIAAKHINDFVGVEVVPVKPNGGESLAAEQK